jgi:hypothetical protein
MFEGSYLYEIVALPSARIAFTKKKTLEKARSSSVMSLGKIEPTPASPQGRHNGKAHVDYW